MALKASGAGGALGITGVASTPTTSIRAWTTVMLLALIFAMGIVDRIVLATLVQPIKADLKLSDTAIGLVQGASVALFYLLFAVPFGWASDRFDRRLILFGGVTIWSLASASCALAHNFAQLFASRCLVGAGEAVLGPCGYPLIASLLPRRRLASAMMLFYLGGTLGIAAGQYIGGAGQAWFAGQRHAASQLIPALAPWRAVFLLTGLPGLVLAALIPLAPRERARARAQPRAPTRPDVSAFLRFFVRHRRFFVSHNIGFGLQQAAIIGAILWNSAFMERTFGWSPARIGAVFGLILLTTSTAAVIGHSRITERLFNRGMRDAHLKWQMLMCLLSIPALLSAYLLRSPLGACVGFAIANLMNGGSAVSGPTVLQLATPEAFRGRASAVYVLIATLLSTALGPAAIGYFADTMFGAGAKLGFAIATCTTVFCVGAAAALARALPAARKIINGPSKATPAADTA